MNRSTMPSSECLCWRLHSAIGFIAPADLLAGRAPAIRAPAITSPKPHGRNGARVARHLNRASTRAERRALNITSRVTFPLNRDTARNRSLRNLVMTASDGGAVATLVSPVIRP
jgi:hypothetical protein